MASFIYFHIEAEDRCTVYFGNSNFDQVFKGATVKSVSEAEKLIDRNTLFQYTRVLVRPKVTESRSPQNSVS